MPIGLCLVAGMGWKPRMKLFRVFFLFLLEGSCSIRQRNESNLESNVSCFFCEQQWHYAPSRVDPDLRQNVLAYGSKHVSASEHHGMQSPNGASKLSRTAQGLVRL